ncbi:MAG TPA: hypothetical protein VK386_01935 [Acidimicrobiales bacterium]|nr:hypothetical protein [Acidimicrobiales bacterium]
MRSRWLTRRAVLAHLALAVWLPGCALAAWWQVGIALGGDGLGWVYSVMWPCFAVFGTIFWWFLVHDDPDTLGARGLRLRSAVTTAATDTDNTATVDGTSIAHRRLAEAEAEDPELASYNAYLSSLTTDRKTWRRR